MKTVKKLEDVEGIVEFYRKKPVKIRAVELKEKVMIKTREGELIGNKGDFLIEGVEGEVYPCDRKIFSKTYNKSSAEDKEEVVLLKIIKHDKNIELKVSKSANHFEVYGFLKTYLAIHEEELMNSFVADNEFELF